MKLVRCKVDSNCKIIMYKKYFVDEYTVVKSQSDDTQLCACIYSYERESIGCMPLDYFEPLDKDNDTRIRLYFKRHSECVDYLLKYFYLRNFKHSHTRRELAYILRIIESHALNQSPYAFRSMCKERMCNHIEFYLNVHEKERLSKIMRVNLTL